MEQKLYTLDEIFMTAGIYIPYDYPDLTVSHKRCLSGPADQCSRFISCGRIDAEVIHVTVSVSTNTSIMTRKTMNNFGGWYEYRFKRLKEFSEIFE